MNVSRSLSLMVAFAITATFCGACGVDRQSTVLGPTPVTSAASGGSTPTPTVPAPPTGATSFAGIWASQSGAAPGADSCTNFQWNVTSQTASTMSGTFTVTCGTVAVQGTATGQLNGMSVPLTATGTATLFGNPGCAFSISGTGTVADPNTLTVPYTGSTCLGPVAGTETLRKRTAETPVIETPQLLSPANNEHLTTRQPTFTFTNAAHSGPVAALVYQLQISEVYSFDSIWVLLQTNEQGGGTQSIRLPNNGPYNKYYFWRVRALDGNTSGAWSAPQAFLLPAEPKAAPPVSTDSLLGCGGLSGQKVVECIHDRLNPPHTVEGAFEITKRVAWALRGEGAGLLIKPGGENIVSWQGISFAAGRICYPDGHIIKILSDVPTTNGASWQDNGFVDRVLYVPAIDPNR